jgi:hypothetical protein
MSERYVPPESHRNEKYSRALPLLEQLQLIERLRKSGEVLKSPEREPPPGKTGDDSQQTNPAATDDTNQNSGQSDSTTSATQSDDQQQGVDDGQLERERAQRIERAGKEIARLLRIERIRAEIAQEQAKGNIHTTFRPDQSQDQ